jgi:hypothetical protein
MKGPRWWARGAWRKRKRVSGAWAWAPWIILPSSRGSRALPKCSWVHRWGWTVLASWTRRRARHPCRKHNFCRFPTTTVGRPIIWKIQNVNLRFFPRRNRGFRRSAMLQNLITCDKAPFFYHMTLFPRINRQPIKLVRKKKHQLKCTSRNQ